jgi:hypothetical protein
MSKSHLNNLTESNEEKELNKQQSDENLGTKSRKIHDEGASGAKDIVLDTTNEIVEALEQELSERKKQIVTSFQLQELNHSSRERRRSSVKSNFVIWSRAEQQ